MYTSVWAPVSFIHIKSYLKCVIEKSDAWDVTKFQHWDFKSSYEDLKFSTDVLKFMSTVVATLSAWDVTYIDSDANCRDEYVKFINVHFFWTVSFQQGKSLI